MTRMLKELWSANLGAAGVIYTNFVLREDVSLTSLQAVHDIGGRPLVYLYRATISAYSASNNVYALVKLETLASAGASYPAFNSQPYWTGRLFCPAGNYTLLGYGGGATTNLHIVASFES